MREIKFRAIPENRYDEDVDSILDSIAFYTEGKGFDDTFVYGHLNGDYILGDTLNVTEEYYNPSYWIKINKDTIMQYTGLKDKNGIEVYEGDIVHARGYYPGEGWFDTGEHDYDFIADVKWDNEKMAYLCNGYYLHEIEEVEIVGNIYENPELLD